MADAQRVEIGFEGGQVISARLSEDDLKDLRKQLEKGGWHDLHTEDGVLSVYLGKVAFLRIASGASRVGFGSAIAVILLCISPGPILWYLTRAMREDRMQ